MNNPWVLVAAIIIILACLVLQNFIRSCRLSDREEELDKREDELLQRELEVERFKVTLAELNPPTAFKVYYVVTEADEAMYDSDSAIKRHVKRQMASTIANDIVKTFEPNESVTSDGRRMLSYEFKIKQSVKQ